MSVPFDLNIEKILENWDVSDAVREVIANALDERLLTGTKDIEISKSKEGYWAIKDYGRGLEKEHLTQKENDEKLANPGVIGKFGIGLKDAFGTFDRNDVKVLVRSRFNDITLGMMEKAGFKGIVTLHALISPPSDPQMIGTEFRLVGIRDDDVKEGMDQFLKFSGERVIEKTEYGEILEKKQDIARVYVNGVRVAEEENFFFSYNITAISAKIRNALNRERKNVGKGAYSDQVKLMLVTCLSKEVAEQLAVELGQLDTGETHDEMKWIDVQLRAVRILNADGKHLFLTKDQIQIQKTMVDEAERSGRTVVMVTMKLAARLENENDINGTPIINLAQFISEYNQSFKFEFVSPDKLNSSERSIYERTGDILELVGGMPKSVNEIKISETMRSGLTGFADADGVYEASNSRIVIKRSALSDLESYAGTLIHEIAHATSGASDVSREFELELSESTGQVAGKALE